MFEIAIILILLIGSAWLVSIVLKKEKSLGDLKAEISEKNEKISTLEESLDKEKKRINEQSEQNKIQFENLANEILEKKSEKFVELNKTNIDQILNPLGKKIEEFEKSVQEKYEKEIEGRTSLSKEIEQLKGLNQKISEDAINLTNALKGDSKTRGNWGELQLEVLLENSGLEKDVHFEMRPTFDSKNGKKTQPDCIVKLPDGKQYVIDSKVSLVAYEKYVNTEDGKEKEKFLKEHIQSIKKHINDLSSKDYTSIYSIDSIDYVFMYVPIQPAWSIATLSDRDLSTIALDKDILLVDGTHLLLLMKVISWMWIQDKQSKNTEEIARQGGALYDKFCNFVEDLQGVGKSIEQANTKYEKAWGKLHEGRGSLTRKTQQLKELGAKTKKALPKELLDDAEVNPLIEEK
tara:strand:- start:1426 stop:2640 length:1215 start_codon:yes stop_codon:yes gene_type:complete